MPVTLVTVPQELFISHSCETSCVNGRAHATARRRSPPHSPGVSSLVWARSRKTQPRPRDQRSRLLLGRKLSGITFSLSSVGGVGRAFRLALGIMERDVLMTGGGWGFCAMRSPLAVCRRRVGSLDGVIPPVWWRGHAMGSWGLTVSSNFARNSLDGAPSFELRSLGLQRFLVYLKNDRWKLRAKFAWWGVVVARVRSCWVRIPPTGPCPGQSSWAKQKPRSLRFGDLLVAPTGVDPVTFRFSVERSTN